MNEPRAIETQEQLAEVTTLPELQVKARANQRRLIDLREVLTLFSLDAVRELLRADLAALQAQHDALTDPAERLQLRQELDLLNAALARLVAPETRGAALDQARNRLAFEQQQRESYSRRLIKRRNQLDKARQDEEDRVRQEARARMEGRLGPALLSQRLNKLRDDATALLNDAGAYRDQLRTGRDHDARMRISGLLRALGAAVSVLQKAPVITHEDVENTEPWRTHRP